jgi:hypothetical protein
MPHYFIDFSFPKSVFTQANWFSDAERCYFHTLLGTVPRFEHLFRIGSYMNQIREQNCVIFIEHTHDVQKIKYSLVAAYISTVYLKPVFRIRLRIRSGFNQGSGSGSGSKRSKLTHEKSFSCCLDVLNGGLYG